MQNISMEAQNYFLNHLKSMFFNILKLLICFYGFFNLAHSAETFLNSPRPVIQHLKVGLVTTHPFVIEKNNYYSGLAFDIWKAIAFLNHFDCEYIDAGKSTDKAVERLSTGEFDVLVGGLGIYSSRLPKGEYSLPFFRAEYVLAAKNISRGFFFNLNTLVDNHLLLVTLLVITSYFLFLSLFWIFEHSYDPKIAKKNYWQGINYLFWLSSLRANFSSPFFPTKTVTKIICMIWQTLLYSLFFSVIAGFSSSLIDKMQNNNQMFLEPKDIGNKPIALFGSKNALKIAKNNNLNIIKSTNSSQEAITLLDNGDVEGIFMLYGIINAFINENNRKDIYISPIKYPDLQLGFMVNYKKANLIPAINWALLKIGENGEKSRICEYYKNIIRYNNCFWY